MAGSGGLQAIEGFGGDLQGRIKAKGAVSASQIIVNGFGDANHWSAHFAQFHGDGLGAFTTNGNQASQLHLHDVGIGFEVGVIDGTNYAGTTKVAAIG